MYFLREIEKIKLKKRKKKITIFVDMDGVIADYRFGEGLKIKSNESGVYLNKRPIKTTIENLRRLSNKLDIELYIISSCLFKKQVEEKNIWLDKYVSFFKHENRIYVIANDFESRKQLKIDKIKEYMNSTKDTLTILIDDTHDILFLAQQQLGESFIPMHVITLID